MYKNKFKNYDIIDDENSVKDNMKNWTHDPFSLVRLNTRNGSDFPKKSFLSSLLAENWSVTSS